VPGPDRPHDEHEVVVLRTPSAHLNRRKPSAPAIERGPQKAECAGLIARRADLGDVGAEVSGGTGSNLSGIARKGIVDDETTHGLLASFFADAAMLSSPAGIVI
jgi:hypothetical protein